jgi:hypothetical protein
MSMRRILLLLTALMILITVRASSSEVSPPEVKLPNWEVPYRLLDTRHVMVRAKINGHGPYNFIVDSGAPALFIATSVCNDAGIKPDEKKWGSADSFQIEGGPTLSKARVRIDDMFQLEGLNGLGVAGVKLSGVIGYEVLSHYRLDFDFTSETMGWTQLAYSPVPFKPVRGGKSDDLEWVGGMAKMLGLFVGKPIVEPTRRGYLGIELVDTDQGVVVTRVLDGSPAAEAGIRTGDCIKEIKGRTIKSFTEAIQLTAAVAAGESTDLTITRTGEVKKFDIKTKEGL